MPSCVYDLHWPRFRSKTRSHATFHMPEPTGYIHCAVEDFKTLSVFSAAAGSLCQFNTSEHNALVHDIGLFVFFHHPYGTVFLKIKVKISSQVPKRRRKLLEMPVVAWHPSCTLEPCLGDVVKETLCTHTTLSEKCRKQDCHTFVFVEVTASSHTLLWQWPVCWHRFHFAHQHSSGSPSLPALYHYAISSEQWATQALPRKLPVVGMLSGSPWQLKCRPLPSTKKTKKKNNNTDVPQTKLQCTLSIFATSHDTDSISAQSHSVYSTKKDTDFNGCGLVPDKTQVVLYLF